jgi:signal transduction histidine kinase
MKAASAMSAARPRWRGTLYLRLVVAWFLIMFIGHLVNVGAYYSEVNKQANARAGYHLAKDLAVLLPMLDTAGVQRATALERMQRIDYQFALAERVAPTRAARPSEEALIGMLVREIGASYPISMAASSTRPNDGSMRMLVGLHDGSKLAVTVMKNPVQLDQWGGLIFALQIVGMLVVTALAARQATLPLARLTASAEMLGSSMKCEPIAEDGPVEVARAAAAFNAMGKRIKDHLAERVRILGAISHDLQTPITRMRLRADLLENSVVKAKFDADLDQMQALVEEGIAYARSTDPVRESACLVDIDAMLDALTGDYADSGQQVALAGTRALMVPTWPHTLRRILVNLTDNAIKFAEQVEIVRHQPGPDQLCFCVRDRGPGIEASQLDAVFMPFFRLESSRNRATGGTGLGLAIARQLALGLGGTLTLTNREGGGLAATLVIPLPASAS